MFSVMDVIMCVMRLINCLQKPSSFHVELGVEPKVLQPNIKLKLVSQHSVANVA